MYSSKKDIIFSCETLYVFIDTEIFVKNKFDWSNKYFQSLFDRISNGVVQVLITDILIQEVKSGLEKLLDENLLALERSKKNSSLLYNLRPKELAYLHQVEPREVLLNDAVKVALNAFDEMSAVKIDFPNDTFTNLFDLYFSKKPPFGQKKKKSEFPDAANFLALNNWAEKNLTDVYIVSGDPDFKTACDDHSNNLNYCSGLPELLDIAIRLEWPEDSWSAQRILDMLSELDEELLNKINNSLEDSGIEVNLGDGHLDYIYATDINLEEVTVFDRHETDRDDFITFEVQLEHTVNYNADVSFSDDEFWHSDIEVSTSGKLSLTADLTIRVHYKNAPSTIEIYYFSYGDNSSANISVPLSYKFS